MPLTVPKITRITPALLASALLILAAWRHWVPVNPTEMTGAVAGAWCAWLTAGQSLWCWPVGMADSLLFASLFGRVHLYGAMGMQLLYVALGGIGWYWWRHGGCRHGPLTLSCAAPATLGVLALTVAVAFPALALSLRHVHDAAPLADAAALALSLAAQFLVTRKLIEHWYASLAADAVYVALYAAGGLYLTSSLYLMHLGMCVYGLWRWQRALVPDGVQSQHA